MITTALNCAKCGGADVSVRFHLGCSYWGNSKTCAYGAGSSANFNSESGEHLHYTCRACGYDWTGRCAERGEQA